MIAEVPLPAGEKACRHWGCCQNALAVKGPKGGHLPVHLQLPSEGTQGMHPASTLSLYPLQSSSGLLRYKGDVATRLCLTLQRRCGYQAPSYVTKEMWLPGSEANCNSNFNNASP